MKLIAVALLALAYYSSITVTHGPVGPCPWGPETPDPACKVR